MIQPKKEKKHHVASQITTRKSNGILILDWDHTVVDGHSHNFIYALQQFFLTTSAPDEKSINDFIDKQIITLKAFPKEKRTELYKWVQDYAQKHKGVFGLSDLLIINRIFALFPTIGDPTKWKALITEWTQEGGILSINTFSSFKLAIPHYLKSIIGLDDKIIQKIHIEENCNTNHKNKNISIQSCLKYFSAQLSKDCLIIFVDDDDNNISSAQELSKDDQSLFKNAIVIHAKNDASHVEKLRGHLKQLKEKTTDDSNDTLADRIPPKTSGRSFSHNFKPKKLTFGSTKQDLKIPNLISHTDSHIVKKLDFSGSTDWDEDTERDETYSSSNSSMTSSYNSCKKIKLDSKTTTPSNKEGPDDPSSKEDVFTTPSPLLLSDSPTSSITFFSTPPKSPTAPTPPSSTTSLTSTSSFDIADTTTETSTPSSTPLTLTPPSGKMSESS